MKRQLARALAAVLFVLSLVSAAPADAGWYSWTRSTCRPWVWVWDEPGNAWFTTDDNPAEHHVHSTALDIYWRHSRECGNQTHGVLYEPVDNGGWWFDPYSGLNGCWKWTQRFVDGQIFYNQCQDTWWSHHYATGAYHLEG